MNYTPSILYVDYDHESVAVIEQHLIRGLAARTERSRVNVFFRADDIGVVSPSFIRLMSLFKTHQIPLCLAVVPVWLTGARLDRFRQICDIDSSLWCWHQHGWQHKNHQQTGKKAEFGSSRSIVDIRADIVRGRDRLQRLFESSFCPVFTPPWNRCGSETLTELKQAGFHAVSTDCSSASSCQMLPLLQNLPINVDLHTRKEQERSSSLENLAAEFETAAAAGSIGIMIHHQRMNDNSFLLMEGLLKTISTIPELVPVHFGEMIT